MPRRVSELVCSLDLDKVIWSSTSRTTNPKVVGSLMNEAADATTTEMGKQVFSSSGLVPVVAPRFEK